MSYINFLGNGAHDHQDPFRRDRHMPDRVKSIGTSHSYLGKITSTKDIPSASQFNSVKEVVIDKAVQVSTVTDKIRAEAQKVWSSLRDGCIGTFTATLIGGISAAIAAIAVGVILPPLWPVAVAVGVVALGLLGFATWNMVRGVEAKAQLKQWNDPIPAYQHQRQLAKQKGFYHAYSSGYKGKIVSEAELEKLWYTSMDNWADRFSSHISGLKHVKVQDIRTFMEESPLQKKAMGSTFGYEESTTKEKQLKFLEELSGTYTSLKGQYDTIRMKTEALKSKIRNERSQALLANDKQLRLNLAPYEALISAQKLALMTQKNKCRQIISSYSAGVQRMRAQRVQSTRLAHGRVGVARRGRTVTAGGRVIPGSGKIGGYSPHGTSTLGGHVIPGTGSTVVTTSAPLVVPAYVNSAKAELSNINAELLRLDIVFQAMTAPIRNLHALNAQKIKSWANGELGKIQASEDKTLLKFHKPIKAILDAYKSREEETPEEVEVEAKVEFAVDPNAPELRVHFEPPKYDKKWSEFVKEDAWAEIVKELKEKQKTMEVIQ